MKVKIYLGNVEGVDKTIEVEGENIRKLAVDYARQTVGTTFQDVSFYDDLYVASPTKFYERSYATVVLRERLSGMKTVRKQFKI